MSFGQAISSAFKNYAVFSGRASRSAFWYFYVFRAIGAGLIAALESSIGSSGVIGGLGFISLIWGVIILLPTLGLMVRRLHDSGRSGWWWFIGFIPLIGFIILIVFWATASTSGDNKYGPQPVA